jgi:hypothetical protein
VPEPFQYASGGTVNTSSWVVLGEDGCTLYTPESPITTSTMTAATAILERAGFTVEQAGKWGDDDPGTAGVLARV